MDFLRHLGGGMSGRGNGDAAKKSDELTPLHVTLKKSFCSRPKG
jgi:hypothetical protein